VKQQQWAVKGPNIIIAGRLLQVAAGMAVIQTDRGQVTYRINQLNEIRIPRVILGRLP
jgi:hypothetical protein